MNPFPPSSSKFEKREDEKPITTVTHHSGREMPVYPGDYVYSGFGQGTLYLGDGEEVSCSKSEAKQKVEDTEYDYRFLDPLSGYTGTYLGD